MRALTREGWRLLREVGPVVVVACVVFQLIRVHLCDRYRVQSSSMEPTLHGNPEHGDLVLVDMTAYRRREPAVWDLVVARNRLSPGSDHLVKRLVAFGPTFIGLREGDMFAGDDPNDLRRVVKKPPSAFRDMRATWFEFDGRVGRLGELAQLRPDSGVWRYADGVIELAAPLEDVRAVLTREAQRARAAEDATTWLLPGHLGTAEPVDTSFVNSDGVKFAAFRGFPRDIGMTVTLIPAEGCRGVQMVIEYLLSYYSIYYPLDGHGRFQVMGIDDGPGFEGPPLVPGRREELTFGYLDGTFFAEVSGRGVFYRHHELPSSAPAVKFVGTASQPANLLFLGLEGGAGRIERLRIFHDVYYQPQPRGDPPFHVQAGEMFLLGDNSFDSGDSRELRNDQAELEDLVGRPFAIIGPPSRMRWLNRR